MQVMLAASCIRRGKKKKKQKKKWRDPEANADRLMLDAPEAFNKQALAARASAKIYTLLSVERDERWRPGRC